MFLNGFETPVVYWVLIVYFSHLIWLLTYNGGLFFRTQLHLMLVDKAYAAQ